MNDLYDVRVQHAQEHYQMWIKQLENNPFQDGGQEMNSKPGLLARLTQQFANRKQQGSHTQR